MECEHCDTAGFNRAIVNLGEEEGIGALCKGCETDVYGVVLNTPLWQREEGCIFCAEEGAFAFPLLECHIERDDEEDIVEYHIDETTPILCAFHAKRLHPDVEPEPATARQTV